MRIKKYSRIFAAALWVVLLAAGCAGNGGQENGSKGGSGNPAEVVSDAGTMQIEGDRLYVGEYTRLLLKDPIPEWEYQDKFLYADAFDGTIYILAEYRSGEGEDISRQFFLTTYSSGATELIWKAFALDFPEKSQWYIQSLAVPEEGKLSFRVLEDGDGWEYKYFLAVTDQDGNLLSLTDPFPEEEEYLWNPVNAGIGDHVVWGADGSMVMCKNEGGITSFYNCNPESGVRDKIEVSAEIQNVYALYPDGNMLYYVDNTQHLYRWNQKTQGLTDMISLQEINFPLVPDYAFLMSGGSGRIFLCSLSMDMLQVFSLSEEENHPEDEIRMAVLWPSNTSYITAMGIEYNYAHWNCPISMEEVEEDERDAFRNRIMAQITAGKGPDLMLVSAEDMVVLAEKGVLMDLTELIPVETMEQLFPCVIQDGTVDGRMVGLTTDIMIETLITADDTWSGESWNLDEFLRVLEENGEWKYPIGEYITYIDSMRCLKVLLPNLCHSDFLDLETGVARFDNDEFIKIMEICKQYAGRSGSSAPIPSQACAARVAWVTDLTSFSKIISESEDKEHLVGYPVDGSGHFVWTHFGYLVVNADSEHKEEIRDYIKFLLDHDNQLYGDHGLGFSVRRDVISDSVVTVDGEPRLIYNIGNMPTLMELKNLKPDGTTYLEEFLDFVDICVAGDKWSLGIEQILEEELESYFQGDKSAQKAAELIQNRVQLYLDELDKHVTENKRKISRNGRINIEQ